MRAATAGSTRPPWEEEEVEKERCASQAGEGRESTVATDGLPATGGRVAREEWAGCAGPTLAPVAVHLSRVALGTAAPARWSRRSSMARMCRRERKDECLRFEEGPIGEDLPTIEADRVSCQPPLTDSDLARRRPLAHPAFSMGARTAKRICRLKASDQVATVRRTNDVSKREDARGG